MLIPSNPFPDRAILKWRHPDYSRDLTVFVNSLESFSERRCLETGCWLKFEDLGDLDNNPRKQQRLALSEEGHPAVSALTIPGNEHKRQGFWRLPLFPSKKAEVSITQADQMNKNVRDF